MTASAHLLVVIPAHDEAANLPLVIEELRRVRPGCEVVVIDDGSTDGTGEVAEGLHVAVVRHPRNRGYGAALVSGYRYALEHGYTTVVQYDADGQHDPARIELLLEELDRGADVVFSSRILSGEGYRPSLPRRMGIWFFARLGRVLTGRPITDPTSGFAAMNRRAAAFLAEVTPADYPDLNVLVMLHRAGFVVREIPVAMRSRLSGESMTHGLVPFIYVPKMMYYLGRIYAGPVQLPRIETRPPAARAEDAGKRRAEDAGKRRVEDAEERRAEDAEDRRVLFANPPTGLYIREDRCQTPVKGISASLRFPIDLAYMAATSRQRGAVPCIRDYPAEGGTAEDFAEDLHRFRPQVVVLSTISPTLEWDLEYCRIAKRIDPSIVTAVKGAHVTVQSRQILERNEALDVVICGESEVAAGEIAAGLPLADIQGLAFRTDSEIRMTPPRPFLADPDSLPFPARDLTRNELYIRPDTRRPQTTIQTGWGCPYRCTYCLAPQISGRKLRSRSAKNILAEIRECVEAQGIRDFYFRADTFTLNRRWVMELCNLIIRSGLPVKWGCNSRVDTVEPEMLRIMREAGCWVIGFGVESGSDEILARVKKGATVEQGRQAVRMCREAGIRAYAFFMLGFPWETEQTARRTLDLIRTIGADFIEMNVPVPFPGTKLAEEAESAGLMEASLLGHDHSKPMIRPYAMTRSRVAGLWRQGFLTFYLRPQQIYRLLKDVDSPKDAFNYVTWGSRFFWRLLTRSE